MDNCAKLPYVPQFSGEEEVRKLMRNCWKEKRRKRFWPMRCNISKISQRIISLHSLHSGDNILHIFGILREYICVIPPEWIMWWTWPNFITFLLRMFDVLLFVSHTFRLLGVRMPVEFYEKWVFFPLNINLTRWTGSSVKIL